VGVSTKQMEVWSGRFGEEYTARNVMDSEGTDALYQRTLGVTRSALNERFIGHLSRDTKILEVGTNIGRQLGLLQTQGYRQLFGVELQWAAVEHAHRNLPLVNIVQGSAFDIPFRDRWFDVVFTAGVLIHLSPKDVEVALREIHRCSSRYIWGHEYWAPEWTEVPYRGHSELLWKTDYAQLYLQLFPDLKLVREERLRSTTDSNIDTMFLLEKAR
jgi:pseudaminic acid biosynthesis-associated methylase